MTSNNGKMQSASVPLPAGAGPGLARAFLIVVAYLVFSWLGLLFKPPFSNAVEPLRGMGFALAVLVGLGRGYWPAVAIGAVLSRVLYHGLFASVPLTPGLVANDILIGAVAAAEAYLGARFLRALWGPTPNFRSVWRLIGGIVLVGPLLCTLLPTAGIASAILIRAFPLTGLLRSWAEWWFGDVLGVMVCVPIALLWPSDRPSDVSWRDIPVPRFSWMAIVYVVLCLVGTAAVWTVATETATEISRRQFAQRVNDNALAIHNRLEAYDLGLEAAAGVVYATDHLTTAKWRRFVTSLNVANHLAGVSGMGIIDVVPRDQLATYETDRRNDGQPDFAVHPETNSDPLFIIRDIEPVQDNRAALGLDISFELGRRDAAIAARDSGLVKMTSPIRLVQRAQDKAGYLILKPLYRPGAEIMTVEQRRAAFMGWVYLPFVLSDLMESVTIGQDSEIATQTYDGTNTNPENQLYSSNDADSSSTFSVQRQISAYGRVWTIVWRDTPAFARNHSQGSAATVLYGGLAITFLLAVFLLSNKGREERIRETVALRTRELTKEMQQTSSILETAVANILLLDGNGVVLRMNEAVPRLFQVSRDKVEGLPFSQLVSGQLAEYFNRSEDPHDTTGYRGEIDTVDGYGNHLSLDLQVSPWLTEDGSRHYTVAMRNITDKRRMERQLRDTQHRLEVALEGAGIGVFDVDLQTGKSIVSDTWKTLMRIDAIRGSDSQTEWRDRVHPDDRAIVERNDRECIAGRAARSTTEYRVMVGDGTWRWMKSDAVGEDRDENGIARRLIGVQTDITELLESKAALKNSEAQFRTAMEATPVGTAIIDSHGRFMLTNPALGTFTGQTAGELVGKTCADIVEPAFLDALQAEFSALVDGTAKSFFSEARFRSPTGAELWGKISVAVLTNADDETQSFVLQVVNITEQKRLEETKSQFVSTVSHELRTPLTSVNGSLGLVLNAMKSEVSDKVLRLLTIAQKNTDRLIVLVNDILDMERITSGNMQLKIVTANLPALVEQSTTDNAPFAAKFGTSYRLELPSEDIPVRVDVQRFQQVMANLLSNAAKFCSSGTIIDIKVALTGASTRVSVTNSGPGIPQAFQEYIFKPFSQADSSSTRSAEGTGLGLHIARQMVERMGGTIGFTSEINGLTTFWVDLPVIRAEHAPDPALADH